MFDAVMQLLRRCGTADSVLPPTEVFNEGWMLRLLLDLLDRTRTSPHPLAFASEARWYSEALLPSRFLPRHRGDSLAESYTHADGLIGHFAVASGERGDALLQPSAQQFLVIEAKLGSSLSAGTKNAPNFDQAARNVACIAHMLSVSQIDPHSVASLGFHVLAPRSQIETGVFSDLVTKTSIERKVRERASAYGGLHDDWLARWFMPTLDRLVLGPISWEAAIAALPAGAEVDVLRDFYARCLQYNPLRKVREISA